MNTEEKEGKKEKNGFGWAQLGHLRGEERVWSGVARASQSKRAGLVGRSESIPEEKSGCGWA